MRVDDHEDVGVGETGEFHRRLQKNRREWQLHALNLSRQFQQARSHPGDARGVTEFDELIDLWIIAQKRSEKTNEHKQGKWMEMTDLTC